MIPPKRKPADVQEAEILGEMGLAPVVKKESAIAQVHTEHAAVQSPEQSKAEAINSLLAKAYEKASTLDLTDDEIGRLTADFPDSDFLRGAGGNQNLIYIQHSSLRARLNSVIGIGKWNMIVRRSWTEEFFTAKKEQAIRVYVEGVLLVRGCYVAEAIGDGTYYKSNAATNFGDAFEIAKSSALRRLCKEFGIGLQAWDKEWCRVWMEKYQGFSRPERKQ